MPAISITTTCAMDGGHIAKLDLVSDVQMPDGWSYVAVSTGEAAWKYLVCPVCLSQVRAAVDSLFPTR